MVHSKGDLERAEPLYAEAIGLEFRSLGKEHPDRAYTLGSYAALLRSRGDNVGAAPHAREALRLREAAFAPTDARLVRTRLAMAEILAALQEVDEAIRQLDAALDAAEAPQFDVEQKRRALSIAAAVFGSLGKSERASEVKAKVEAMPGKSGAR
jgi:tetratricopeptide (TPR) repeat protein